MEIDPIEQRLLNTFRQISTDRAKLAAVALIENCVRLQGEGVRAAAEPDESAVQEPAGQPHVIAEASYTVNEVCVLVRCSRTSYNVWKRRGDWPIPEIQPALGHPRYAGVDIIRYFNGEFAPVGRRAARARRR